MTESLLNTAIRHFEAVEANLGKAEALVNEIESAIPSGIAFGQDVDYERNCRDFTAVYAELPKIDGWKPDIALMDFDEIGQSRLDAQEVGEIECVMSGRASNSRTFSIASRIPISV
ncbi:MAG: hypothetical protein U5J62_01225 [Desulfurivibrio sp.]|nr:hypothetical protein [Desulfurivibrio sp.]